MQNVLSGFVHGGVGIEVEGHVLGGVYGLVQIGCRCTSAEFFGIAIEDPRYTCSPPKTIL